MTTENQRDDEQDAIEWIDRAIGQRDEAFIALHSEFLPIGNGILSKERKNKYEAADAEAREAQANMHRISEEIRTGKRQ